MNFKEEIQNVLDDLKKFNFDRRGIEIALDYGVKSIDQQLSRGGNKRLLTVLKLLLEVQVLKKAIDGSDESLIVNDGGVPYGITETEKVKQLLMRNVELEDLAREQRAIINDLKFIVNQGKETATNAASM